MPLGESAFEKKPIGNAHSTLIPVLVTAIMTSSEQAESGHWIFLDVHSINMAVSNKGALTLGRKKTDLLLQTNLIVFDVLIIKSHEWSNSCSKQRA